MEGGQVAGAAEAAGEVRGCFLLFCRLTKARGAAPCFERAGCSRYVAHSLPPKNIRRWDLT